MYRKYLLFEQKEIEKQIAADCNATKGLKGKFAIVGPCSSTQCWLYLFYDPNLLQISELVSNAWGVDLNKFITVAIQFSAKYLNSVCEIIGSHLSLCRIKNRIFPVISQDL